MELKKEKHKYKINTLTRKQAKSYTDIALRNLLISDSNFTEEEKKKIINNVIEEIDVVMKIYEGQEATSLAYSITEKLDAKL